MLSIISPCLLININTDEAKNLTDEAKDLETSITDLQTTAQSMKDEATKNLKSAEDDLATFFETGGNPLNKKDKKSLQGSVAQLDRAAPS